VAVKLISQELAKKDSARERFRREATAAAQLRSAHVVQILDHGIDGDQPFIVMELLDGEDLFERLAHRNRLTLRETSKIVTQVARALSRAHAAGIVHRDLKPENVFICPNEDDEVVKVLDFGVAKVKDAAKVTMQKTGVGTLIGTPHYMSPEQVKGIGEVDYHADLWALGVIAFQCVTGELPYDSDGVGDLLIKITMAETPVPSHVYPSVPAAFDQWFAKACAREAAKRFQSAREMAVALVGVVNAVDGGGQRSTMRPPVDPAHATSDQPARSPTHQLEADDWEEVDALDDAPHVSTHEEVPAAAPPMAGDPPTPPPSRPHAQAVTLADAPTPTSPRVPRPTTNPPSSPRPPVRPSPPPAVAVPAVAAVPESHEAHDIVFDETGPAHDVAMPLMVRAPAIESSLVPAPPPSVPAPPPSSPRVAANPPPAPAAQAPWDAQQNGARPMWEAQRAPEPKVIAPVMPPPRAPDSGPGAPPPRPAPPSPRSAPQSNRSAHPTGVPVVTPLDLPPRPMLMTEPPIEFDGSKRRRMVRFFFAGLVIFALGLTWTVVRSQIDLSPGSPVPPPTSPTPTVAAPSPPPQAPTPVATATATATTTQTAIDPGKVTHPGKPTATPSVRKAPPVRPRNKAPGDGTIVIPEPEDESQ
jgi:serine/threonine-protein kinase